MPAENLVKRVSDFDWQGALVRLAHFAAIIGNDEKGPHSPRARRLIVNGITNFTANTEPSRRALRHAMQFLEKADQDLVVAHEEAISFMQHVVILHGSETSLDSPADGEVALWLLAAGDYLEAWQEPDSRRMTASEESIAEQVKVYRFNRSVDSLREIVRTLEIFEGPPTAGALVPPRWERLQQVAFGGSYREYFEDFLHLLFLLSHGWGREGNPRELPVFVPQQWSKSVGPEGGRFIERLREITSSRIDLQRQIRVRMRSDNLLPHAPTALLHRPFVDLGEQGIVATSPWNVRAMLRTGIWAKYLAAAKELFGGDKRGGDEWTRTFGYLFEGWLGEIARMAEGEPGFRGRLYLPTHPGAPDEIEDVVIVEDGAAVLFSAKGRMMKESIARHAKSRSSVVDWYQSYFFDVRKGEFREGALRQLHARVERIRAGEFEPRVDRNAKLYPVLVTYDMLCDNPLLYEWIAEQCSAKGLLGQDRVAPVTLADVGEYEHLLGYAAAGRSVGSLLEEREGRWRSRRLDVQLYESNGSHRVPHLERLYDGCKETLLRKFGPALAKAKGRPED